MSYEAVIAFLRSHSLLRGIPDYELQVVADAIETIHFTDGQVLMLEGEAAADCFFISQGTVQVSSRNLVGQPLLLAELGAGALVGEIGLLRHEPRTARVTAVGDVTALRLDRMGFERLAERSPLFHESLLMTVRLRMIHRLLRKASIWSGIPDAELRGLAEITAVRQAAKGAVLVAPGERIDQFYMISRGRVEVADAKKRKTTLREGDFFGEAELLGDSPSEIEVIAAEDTELLVMGKSEFLSILSYYAPIRHQFMEIVRIRAPHLAAKAAGIENDGSHGRQTQESLPAAEARERQAVVLPQMKERWIDVLLWLGGGFIALSLLALFLQSGWLNMAVLMVGGLVGPATFVMYIRGHQLLGFGQARLGLIFAASAAVAVPLAWVAERTWLFGANGVPLYADGLRMPLSISLIEESAKLLVCLLLFRTRQMRFLMDAVVFGAAAGMGFAAVESVLYGWAHLGDDSSIGMLSVLWIRALLSPFGHGTWTAIAAAGLWTGAAAIRAKATGPSRRLTRLGRALVLPLIVIGLHAMWDYPFAGGLAKTGMMLAVGVVGVTLLYVLLRAGRREEFQAYATMNPFVQESLKHADPDEMSGGELRCEGCGTASPRETRYCARCGRALRIN